MKTMAMQTLSTKKHRIISALLAVALLLSWLPAMALHAHAADAQTISFCPDGGSDNPGAYTLSEHQWAVDATNTSASIPARTSNWVIYPNSFWKAQFAMDEVLVLDFQVAQSGSYAVSLAGWQLDALGIVAAVSVDGFVLGNADFSHPGGSGTNENAVMELGAITLPAGTHKLKIHRTNTTSGGDLMFLKSLTLTPTTIDSGMAQTVIFRDASKSKPDQAVLGLNGWALNTEDTSPAIPTRPGNYNLNGTFTKCEFASGERLALDFNVRADGYYQVSLTGWKVEKYGILGAIAIDGTEIGTYDFSDMDTNSTLQDATETLGKLQLSAGTHQLTITKADADGARGEITGGFAYMWLCSMDLTPTTPDPVTQDMAFVMSLCDAAGEEKECFNAGDVIYAKALLTGGESYAFGAVQADVCYDSAKLELVDDATSAGENMTINKHYSADSVRLGYGGDVIRASAPYLLGTVALRVKDTIADGDTAITFANANVSAYNDTTWADSTAQNATAHLHNITVTFSAGEHGTMEDAVFYARYNEAGLYTARDYQTAAEEPAPTVETGYRLADADARWKNASGATSFAALQARTFAESESYTAQYAQKTYAVRFYDSDGSALGAAQDIAHGGTATAADPVKAGNEFRGWYVVTSAEQAYAEGDTLYTSAQISATAVTADISYKALYRVNVYSVTVAADNATIDFASGVAEGQAQDGAEIVFTVTAKSGYTMEGATVTYQVATEAPVTLTADSEGKYTIPGAAVKGNITISVALKLDAAAELVAMEQISGYRVLKIAAGNLPEGKVYQYNGTTPLYYSAAHDAYLCLVPEGDADAAAKISLADGAVSSIARGDINGDAAVDTLDAMLVYTYYNNVDSKFDALVAAQNAALLFALDYNGDFKIDILDVTAIIIAYLGL